MLITKSRGTIHIQAPAKVNLFLEVMGKRSDGYHELETVLCPISLYDHLSFIPSEDADIVLELELPEGPLSGCGVSSSDHDPAWHIPSDRTNLVVRAVEAVRRRLGIVSGARLRLRKRIPAAAGLGGGSSDAAAAIVAALIAWGHWHRPTAYEIAAQLGSDVTFFLGAPTGLGLMLATGRGEICTPIDAAPQLDIVITHPPQGCSTRQVYEHFSRTKSGDLGAIRRHWQEIVAACEAGQVEKIGAALWNTLQFPATYLNHWIELQLSLLRTSGANYALMSGSGSSCFALVPDSTLVTRIGNAAREIGIPRVLGANAVYLPSIEQQLEAG